jgi:glutathione S-transferase
MAATLLTFAPMIDCECSRFLLGHYGVAYQEAPHIFGWASVLAVFRSGTPQIPLLYGGEARCTGPHAIVEFYETKCAPERRLIPANSQLAMQVNADWARFNGILAGSTAVLAYYHLLPHRAIMIEPFCRGVPTVEAAVMKAAYPAFAGFFKLLLRLNPANAADALTQTRILFDEADARLADDRPFLVGDTLTLGDIALATATAPLLFPDNYRAPIPAFADMPPALQAIITELRQHPTARFVERIFRDFRGPPMPAVG